jgi:ABC-type transport system substrate-binding protein
MVTLKLTKKSLTTFAITALYLTMIIIPIAQAQEEEEKYFFELNVMIYKGYQPSVQTVEILQEEFKKIGIKLTYDVVDGTIWNDRGFKTALERATSETGGYDLHLGNYGLGSAERDPDNFALTLSSSARWPGGWNWWHWSNADVDALFDEGRGLIDREERYKIYSELLYIMMNQETAPVLPIGFMKIARMMSADLEGYVPTIGTSHGVREWSLSGQTGGTVKYASTRDPVNLLPWWGNIGMDMYAYDVYSRLCHYDADYNIIPEIAESWEVSDDGLEITFKLVENASWHDGEPFTADDVVFTFTGLMDKETGTTMWSRVSQNIAAVEKTGEYEVKFTLVKKNAGVFATVFTSIFLIPEHIMGEVPYAEWKFSDIATTHPIGTGAYKFVEWIPQESLTLEANEDYFGGRPALDTRISVILPDAQTALAALQNGDVHYLSGTGYTAEQVEMAREDPDLQVIMELAMRPFGLSMNLAHPILNNAYVRKAMSAAIPRQQLADDVLGGQMIAGHAITNELHWIHNATVGVPEYNIEQAKQYMELAGYPMEYLEPPETTPLSQNLIYAVVGIVVGLAIGYAATRYMS